MACSLPRNQAVRPEVVNTIPAHSCRLELCGFNRLMLKGLRSPTRGRCVCAALGSRNCGVFCDYYRVQLTDVQNRDDAPKSLGTTWGTGTEGTDSTRALHVACRLQQDSTTVTRSHWPARYPEASGLTSHEPTETRQKGLLAGIFLTEEMIVFVFLAVVFTSIFRKG